MTSRDFVTISSTPTPLKSVVPLVSNEKESDRRNRNSILKSRFPRLVTFLQIAIYFPHQRSVMAYRALKAQACLTWKNSWRSLRITIIIREKEPAREQHELITESVSKLYEEPFHPLLFQIAYNTQRFEQRWNQTFLQSTC